MRTGAQDERGPLRAAFGGLTTRGRSFLAAGGAAVLCAYLLGQPDLLRVGALLVTLPLLCVVVLHRSRCQVTAARQLSPPQVSAGAEALVRLRVDNPMPAPSGSLLLEDLLPYALGPHPRFVLDRIEPGGRRELSYRVRADVRGRYPLGPLQLRLSDPFGMVELSRSFHSYDTMTVLPKTEVLPPVPLDGGAGGGGPSRHPSLAVTGEDDVIPRDYRHGDDLRRVHWRSTARRGALMVRREEKPLQARCTVLLDTRRGGYAGAGPGSPFERAVSGAASVLSHLAEHGYAIRLVTDTGLVVPGPGTESPESPLALATVLDTLAIVDHSATTSLEPARQALRELDHSLLIAFLGTVDADQIALLARTRHRTKNATAFVAAAQIDPSLEADRLRQLREAGWNVLGHDPTVPLAWLWQRAAQDHAGMAGGW